MSSNQKQRITSSSEGGVSTFDSFMKKLSAMKDSSEVELLYKKLQYLGVNFDPFSGEVSSECQQILDNVGLVSEFVNPYQGTNLLLRLLDKTEEHLNNLKQ